MAGIQPTTGASQLTSPAAGHLSRNAPAGKGDFANVLEKYVGEVNGDQEASAEAIRELLTGNTEDVFPVVQAMAKADLSFKLLMGVRNKVIEAYKQTMNMQV